MSTAMSPPLPVDLVERIRKNQFSTLPDQVRIDQVTELVDLVPPADFDPIDEQARWLLIYGFGTL